MQTKHFLSDPQRMVELALKSIAIVQPELRVDPNNKIVYAPTPTSGRTQVSVISGGGAGHEPSFTGLVGEGLLSAAVSGSIFASPSSRQVQQAIESVDASRGVLVTVMRYTGDILNFGLAVEKARAINPKLKIEMLIVNDDVAVTRSKAGKVGRRGIAGTVLIHKITGSMAAAGYALEDVTRVGHLAADNLVSIGVSLNRVHVPGQRVEKGDSVESTEVELGMGIHNETGCGRRSGKSAELDDIVSEMLRQLLDKSDSDRNYLPQQASEMIVMVNNLGALSVLELGSIAAVVIEQLEQTWGVTASRVYSGTFMTSLDGPGFSISLLNKIDTKLEHSVFDLLDAPSNARGWQSMKRYAPVSKTQISYNQNGIEGEVSHGSQLNCDMDAVKSQLDKGLQALIDAEPDITRYDSIVGDGDCGTTLKRGAEAIRKQLQNASPEGVIALLSSITATIEETMDGTSGALYAIFTNAMLRHFGQPSQQAAHVDTTFWIAALKAALQTLGMYTPAQVGDRTLMDALIPFVETLEKTNDLQAASKAAIEGANKTKDMSASLGRTVYVGNENEWKGKIPDPGAWGLSKFLQGIASA